MSETSRDVWITGVGIVSCLGEGSDVHGLGLSAQGVKANTAEYAPYAFFPLPAGMSFDAQIPKKSDQRQMALCQRIGTYAAGLALQSAALKDDKERLARMDMVTTTTGGERDVAVDSAVLSGIRSADDPAQFLNQRLTSDLRPTFFLGQLPNLLAGNIAIVHGVTGSARTLVGEEAAGVDAVKIAAARVASGQGDLVLVGASCNGSRKDLLLHIVMSGHARSGELRPVFDRASSGGGMALGSIGAFLVLEAAEHARARGVRPVARLARVVSDAAADDTQRQAVLQALWSELQPALGARVGIISGASGAEPATAIERGFLSSVGDRPLRATGTFTGHGLQAQFPMNIGIAALLLQQGRLYPASDGIEQRVAGDAISQIVVTGVGRHYGEGLALLEAVA
ncbi:3-oxoacyl-ACP synthase [Afipia sp. P52-10]|uniref:beta-ketoacyl-ACP synthase n=1 Tax=Afipia sp. P52-10 TaxID=1429916 RepID=UPI0003DF1E8D|nr:beta-ketoacyl-ACP synthase [Afipia sp. P52-10]ETR76987.1 3-oxoacyl-ACP synthase [Afipia sp. P52-10]